MFDETTPKMEIRRYLNESQQWMYFRISFAFKYDKRLLICQKKNFNTKRKWRISSQKFSEYLWSSYYFLASSKGGNLFIFQLDWRWTRHWRKLGTWLLQTGWTRLEDTQKGGQNRQYSGQCLQRSFYRMEYLELVFINL